MDDRRTVQHEVDPRPGETILDASHLGYGTPLLEVFDLAKHSETQAPPDGGQVRMIGGAIGRRNLKILRESLV
jgi:hypothetical protein